MTQTTVNITVFRKTQDELVVWINGKQVVLYNENHFHFDDEFIDSKILTLTLEEFEAFQGWISQHQGLFEAFKDLYSSWRCAGMKDIQPQYMNPDNWVLLRDLDLLTPEELEAVAKFEEKIKKENAGTQRAASPTQIYLMKDERTGYHKIGRSNSPQIRERTLQSDNPLIVMVSSFPGTVGNEKEWHAVFADKRIRGEWFDLTEEDVQLFIATMSR